MSIARKKPYLNNRDLLKEIHTSKTSFCSFTDEAYADYDIILPNLERINMRTIATAKRNRVARLAKLSLQHHEKEYPSQKFKLTEFITNWKKIPKTTLIFRIVTFDHIPLEPNRKKTPKTIADHHVKLNFEPFQHWKFDENDNLICVGKSHWQGGLENGWYCRDHGSISTNLAKMYMKLTDRYASRGNWRGYCVDDQTEALTQRGWLNIDSINEKDIILSYDINNDLLKWSKVKSIFRDIYNGKMFKLTNKYIDALITPGHKFITKTGLKKVEYLSNDDDIIISGTYNEKDNIPQIYIDKYSINIKDINFHHGRTLGNINKPTINYKGRVWCPETEYGCFMARRNGTVYLTGNTYNDEMRNQGIAQLTQVCLQFNEAKSENPFAYYTTIINAAFTRVLNLEKRGRDIRDDILEMNEFNPSFARQGSVIDKKYMYNNYYDDAGTKIDPAEHLKWLEEREKEPPIHSKKKKK